MHDFFERKIEKDEYMLWLTVGYCVIHRKYKNGRWVVQGAEPLFLPYLVCDQICQPSNEDEDEMKIDSHYQTDPYSSQTHINIPCRY